MVNKNNFCLRKYKANTQTLNSEWLHFRHRLKKLPAAVYRIQNILLQNKMLQNLKMHTFGSFVENVSSAIPMMNAVL